MLICCAALEHQDRLLMASLPPSWSSSNPASKLLLEIFLNYKLHHINPLLQDVGGKEKKRPICVLCVYYLWNAEILNNKITVYTSKKKLVIFHHINNGASTLQMVWGDTYDSCFISQHFPMNILLSSHSKLILLFRMSYRFMPLFASYLPVWQLHTLQDSAQIHPQLENLSNTFPPY